MKALRIALAVICLVVFMASIYVLIRISLRYSLVKSERPETISMEYVPHRFLEIGTDYIWVRKDDYLSYLLNIIAVSSIAVISSVIGLVILLYSIYRSKKEIILKKIKGE